VQKSFTILGRLRDLEAHLGNHLGRGKTAAPGTVHGAVPRPGPLAENLGDGVAFFATELEERHRSFQTSAPNSERTRLNYSTTDKNVKSCKPNRKVKYSWVSYGVKHELLTYFRSSVVPHGQLRERLFFHFGRNIRDYPPEPAEGLTLKHLFQPFKSCKLGNSFRWFQKFQTFRTVKLRVAHRNPENAREIAYAPRREQRKGVSGARRDP
jgi:hypothetical protein